MILPGGPTDAEYGRLLQLPGERGSRGFTCRDPEGHLWSVGTYDPWTEGE